MNRRFHLLLAAAFLGGLAAAAWPEQPAPATVAALPEQFPPACTAISAAERQWGLQVLAAKLSRDRTSLEVRLRVLDHERARALDGELGAAAVVEAASGLELGPPASGPEAIRATGQILRLAFSNAAGFQPKQRVVVRIGGFRKDNVKVIG
jgi:hypothetical protein